MLPSAQLRDIFNTGVRPSTLARPGDGLQLEGAEGLCRAPGRPRCPAPDARRAPETAPSTSSEQLGASGLEVQGWQPGQLPPAGRARVSQVATRGVAGRLAPQRVRSRMSASALAVNEGAAQRGPPGEKSTAPVTRPRHQRAETRGRVTSGGIPNDHTCSVRAPASLARRRGSERRGPRLLGGEPCPPRTRALLASASQLRRSRTMCDEPTVKPPPWT